MITGRSVSLADQIFDRLEKDILSGVYQKGQVITEAKLSEDLGVSRTPIREAIRRLEQEHLIEDSSKGLVVLGITWEDANSIYEIRKRIEGLAAGGCAVNASAEQKKELSDLVDLQEYYANKKDFAKAKELDSEFHEKIYKYCGSMALCDTLIPLHKKIQKFRQVSIEDKERAAVSISEHRNIIEAVKTGDPKKAEAVMYDHICCAHKNLESIFNQGK